MPKPLFRPTDIRGGHRTATKRHSLNYDTKNLPPSRGHDKPIHPCRPRRQIVRVIRAVHGDVALARRRAASRLVLASYPLSVMAALSNLPADLTASPGFWETTWIIRQLSSHGLHPLGRKAGDWAPHRLMLRPDCSAHPAWITAAQACRMHQACHDGR